MESINNITLKSEYMKLRQSLTDYFIMFCLYDSKNEEAYLELQDFLIDLKSKFNLAIYLVDSNNAEESLIQSLTPQQSDKEMTKPYFALAHPHIADIELLQSNDTFFIYKVIERYVNYYKHNFNSEKEETFNKITQLVNSFPIVIFIKGTPHEPFCKFSRAFMELINNLKFDYRSYNIFKDDKIRGFMKFYHGFKTFPQIFINGKLIGGLDILKEQIEKGEIFEKIPQECRYETKVNEVKNLLHKYSDKKIIFFKGQATKNGETDYEKVIDELNKLKNNKDEKDNLIFVDLNKNLIYESVLGDLFKNVTYPMVILNHEQL